MLRKLLKMDGLVQRLGPPHRFWRELGIAVVVGGVLGGVLAWIVRMLSSTLTGFILGAVLGVVFYLRRKLMTTRPVPSEASEKK
jgi:hypothetical protein